MATNLYENCTPLYHFSYLIGTLVGALIGVLLILITPAIGFIQLLYPLVSALIGYYAAALLSRHYISD